MQQILPIECSALTTTYHRYNFDRLTKFEFKMLWLWKWGDFDPLEYEYE